ncbi:MAG: hypothetical protein NVS3B21_34200 [Acidimicrobiales bacterium]
MCDIGIEVTSLDDDGLRERVLALGALADQVDAAKLWRRWSMLADADGPRPDDHDHDTASCSQTLNGRVQIDANLDTECGAIRSARMTDPAAMS